MKQPLRKLICIVFAILMLAHMNRIGEGSAFAEYSAKSAKKSVVRVLAGCYYDGEYMYGSSGTGICVGRDPVEYVITNKHVVSAEMEEIVQVKLKSLSEEELNDPEKIIELLSLDSNKVSMEIVVVADNWAYHLTPSRGLVLSNIDLALLHVDGSIKDRQAIPFGSTDSLESMDAVFALGYPGIVEQFDDRAADSILSGLDDLTATDGIVSRKNVIMEGVTYIQHTAVINHGNSGGPLINENGELIGVNTSVWGDAVSNVYCAIDVNEVTRFLKQNNVDWIDIVHAGSTASSTVSSLPPAMVQKEPLKQIPFTGSVGYFRKVPFSSASASSELNSGGITFQAGYAIDDSTTEGKKRPWIEGTSGDGVGESLKLQFSKSQSICLLAFDLGYASDQYHYFRNSRPSKLMLRFSDGSKLECSFEDSFSTQYVYFNRPVETSYVEISIISVYTRSTEDWSYFYEDRDTGIFLVRAYEE